jgi:lipopolysaccharide/colanic/teichoic acid biosynthesis glycosyltransferase
MVSKILTSPGTVIPISATALWILSYYIINIYILNYQFEHPDSIYYQETTAKTLEYWTTNAWSFIRYPEYTNILTLVYYITLPHRFIGEGLNLLALLIIAYFSYSSVLKVSNNKIAAYIAAILFVLSPYVFYLSTQLLRDTLVFLGIALITNGILLKNNFKVIGGFLIITYLRSIFGFTLLPFLLIYLLKERKYYILIITILIGVTIFSLEKLPLEAHDIPIPKTKELSRSVVITHTEFFEQRDVKRFKINQETTVGQIARQFKYIYKLPDFLFFPNPLNADNTREYLFALNMLYWYIILSTGIFGLLSYRLSFDLILLIVIAFTLGLALVITVDSQSAFIRWRLPLFYLLTIPLSIGIAQIFQYENLKRSIDITLAVISLLVLMPLSIVLLLIIKKPIFVQERVGLNGKTFKLYKFRSMISGSDGLVVSDKDNRITSFGKVLRKTTLDEIPELINVIKGDMSIVGPRALAKWDYENILQDIPNFYLRNQIKPGMIGLAQISSDRGDNVSKLKYDLMYIDQRNILFDIQIFFRGIIKSLRGSWK